MLILKLSLKKTILANKIQKNVLEITVKNINLLDFVTTLLVNKKLNSLLFIEQKMKMLEEFVEMLQQDFRKIHKFDLDKRIILTEKDSIDFEKASYCSICEYVLKKKKNKSHCHFTIKFRGAAQKL